MLKELALAKVNLNLHIGRLVEDLSHPYFGYHPLSSLVAFADFGDELRCVEAGQTSLDISGPFGDDLQTSKSNLVLKAYQAVAEKTPLPSLKFHLIKYLPVASGIGGGSADAAAALRLMRTYADLSESDWLEIAMSLGADVPVCLYSKTCIMKGIGEDISFLPGMGQLHAVLINSGIQVSTGDMFNALDKLESKIEPNSQSRSGTLLSRTLHGTNSFVDCVPDLTDSANMRALFEQIEDCQLLRMSGSGATFFAVFESADKAHKANEKIKSLKPDWWVQQVLLGDSI